MIVGSWHLISVHVTARRSEELEVAAAELRSLGKRVELAGTIQPRPLDSQSRHGWPYKQTLDPQTLLVDRGSLI
eukprot:642702-Rhodomonas_salina.3